MSCNIWYALTGLETGGAELVDYAGRLGFGAPLPFDLPTAVSQVTNGDGSAPGGFVDDVELANAAYGQAETFVTPLQMALVAATVANDGELMRPRLVTGDRAARAGRRDDRAGDGRRASSTPDDAAAITEAMVAAVEGELGRAVHDRREDPGRHDGRQVRHGRARRPGRAALVVHRLRPGRGADGRDRGPRRAGRPRRRGRGARSPGDLMELWTCERDGQSTDDPARRDPADDRAADRASRGR